ncbi:MAG: hypothetical protein QG673_1252 [Pseudomonadota bacterium]|nr:hypothetical protein [Pseudomonadota bacterium]
MSLEVRSKQFSNTNLTKDLFAKPANLLNTDFIFNIDRQTQDDTLSPMSVAVTDHRNVDSAFLKLKSAIQKISSAGLSKLDNENINFGSYNAKKIHFINAVLVGLNHIVISTNPNADDINRLVDDFTHNPSYLPDLQIACTYLLEDRAIHQGGEDFHKFIYMASVAFKTIESLAKLKHAAGGNFTNDEISAITMGRGAKIKNICDKFKTEINNYSNSRSKYGFKAAAYGALIGAISSGGVVAGGVAGLSFMAGTFASLQSMAAALLTALGIAAVGGATITAVTIALPVTIGLAIGAVGGLAVYKGYQYHKYNKAEKRLLEYTPPNNNLVEDSISEERHIDQRISDNAHIKGEIVSCGNSVEGGVDKSLRDVANAVYQINKLRQQDYIELPIEVYSALQELNQQLADYEYLERPLSNGMRLSNGIELDSIKENIANLSKSVLEQLKLEQIDLEQIDMQLVAHSLCTFQIIHPNLEQTKKEEIIKNIIDPLGLSESDTYIIVSVLLEQPDITDSLHKVKERGNKDVGNVCKLFLPKLNLIKNLISSSLAPVLKQLNLEQIDMQPVANFLCTSKMFSSKLEQNKKKEIIGDIIALLGFESKRKDTSISNVPYIFGELILLQRAIREILSDLAQKLMLVFQSEHMCLVAPNINHHNEQKEYVINIIHHVKLKLAEQRLNLAEQDCIKLVNYLMLNPHTIIDLSKAQHPNLDIIKSQFLELFIQKDDENYNNKFFEKLLQCLSESFHQDYVQLQKINLRVQELGKAACNNPDTCAENLHELFEDLTPQNFTTYSKQVINSLFAGITGYTDLIKKIPFPPARSVMELEFIVDLLEIHFDNKELFYGNVLYEEGIVKKFIEIYRPGEDLTGPDVATNQELVNLVNSGVIEQLSYFLDGSLGSGNSAATSLAVNLAHTGGETPRFFVVHPVIYVLQHSPSNKFLHSFPDDDEDVRNNCLMEFGQKLTGVNLQYYLIVTFLHGTKIREHLQRIYCVRNTLHIFDGQSSRNFLLSCAPSKIISDTTGVTLNSYGMS